MGKDSFRVQTGAKKIEVNDDGEFITLNLGDQSFLPKLAAMIDNFNAKLPEYETRAKELNTIHATVEEIKNLPEETEEEKHANLFADLQRVRDLSLLNEKIHRDLMSEVDGVFNDDVCRKVFGNIVPSMDAFTDFFEQLTPYVEKYAMERNKKMSKYSAGRVGNA